METKDLLVTLLIVLLVVTIITLSFRSSSHASKAEEAGRLGEALVSYLDENDYRRAVPACRAASPSRTDLLIACLDAIGDLTSYEELFRGTDFENPRGNETGYIVVRNDKGSLTFASRNFTLTRNNELAARGCTTPGDIAPGFTCRLDFTAACGPGDNLEVKYNNRRVHLRTC